jgi:endonuclease/exonuclease/phosphatase family metal-dependent hydrolase
MVVSYKSFLLSLLFSFLVFNGISQETDKTTLRVFTYNILHGATMSGDFNLDTIAAVIKLVKPDLVALQEVDFKTQRAKGYDLATELGWRTQMVPLFGLAMPFDGGAYGEGILAKFPIIASRNVPLPHSQGNEPRCALEVMVQLESGDTISFIGTHLEHQMNSSDRIDQVKKINAVFKKNKYPTILAGDFNATPESEPISILKQNWKDSEGQANKPTYPSDNPKKKIDYIFYYPADRWEVIEYRVICDSVASDHCGILVVLQLK